MKRLIAMLLTMVMLFALFPMGTVATAAAIEKKPFYLITNNDYEGEQIPYVYSKVYFSTPKLKENEYVAKISALGSSDPSQLAENLKEQFDDMPEGTRFITLVLPHAVLASPSFSFEDVLFMDEEIKEIIKEALDDFLFEYRSIGGELDGICTDVEYQLLSAWEIHAKQYYKDNKLNNIHIYQQIMEDPRYATEIRPMLVERGFKFYTGPEVKKNNEVVSCELYSIANAVVDEYGESQDIWNRVMTTRLVEALNESVYDTIMKYYPDITVLDYRRNDSKAWMKNFDYYGDTQVGNGMKMGNTSNYDAYCIPLDYRFYYKEKTEKTAVYKQFPGHNHTYYKRNAFNTTLAEVNRFKKIKWSSDDPLSIIVSHYNSYSDKAGTNANTPYYAEAILHLMMLDPKPLSGYFKVKEIDPGAAASNDYSNEKYLHALSVVSDLLVEMNRLAGYSDRKPIYVPDTWNGEYILSGMYTGGRNLWRITPNTAAGVSLASFKVKDKAPTFSIDGQTIIFPQGRIIADGSVREVGTCGYWIETPKNVMPVVISDADRYRENPSLLENFEGYAAGSAFTSTTALPKQTWKVSGNATVQANGNNKALAITGNTTLENVQLPQNVTAGDAYAKQQAWEVSVTLLNTNGILTLLKAGEGDSGIVITNGSIDGFTLTPNVKYTVKRELNFNNSTSSYTIYDANYKAVKTGTVSLTVAPPVTTITLGCSGVSGTVLLDDYKLYPTGVATVLELYDAKLGTKLENISQVRNQDTAYRMSWMNASQDYKVAYVYNNNTVLQKIEMAPGQDGFVTGVVTGSGISISVKTENGVAKTLPNYDNGNFNWVAETSVDDNTAQTPNGGGVGNTTGSQGTSGGSNQGQPSGGSNQGQPSGGSNQDQPSGDSNQDTPTDNTVQTESLGNAGNSENIGSENTTETSEITTGEPTEPKPNEKGGIGGGVIALIVIGSILVLLGGGFALCWFVIKPSWLMNLDLSKIKAFFAKLKR